MRAAFHGSYLQSSGALFCASQMGVWGRSVANARTPGLSSTLSGRTKSSAEALIDTGRTRPAAGFGFNARLHL